MTDTSTERRAYFASLATPDLIVCATIERGSFTPDDLVAIHDELLRRGVDPARLALPRAVGPQVTGPSPDFFSGPLPEVGRWWSEGWTLFTRHLSFLISLSLVLFVPYFVLSPSAGAADQWAFSLGMIASVLLMLASDALVTAAVLRGLCRRMTTGHCSLGRAISLGLERWAWVFKNSLKAFVLSVGPGLFLIALGASLDEGGLVALGVILLIYPGIPFFLRYTWVQPLAVLQPKNTDPLKASRQMMTGRYGRVLSFFILAAVLFGVAMLAGALARVFLPGRLLDSFAFGYAGELFTVCLKTALMVGFLHVNSSTASGPAGEAATQSAMPAPPAL
jgi:hypothetical protein